MHELAGKAMLVRTHRRVDPLPSIKKTLRAHYDRKRRHYGLLHPDFYDRDLRRLFSDDPSCAANMKARGSSAAGGRIAGGWAAGGRAGTRDRLIRWSKGRSKARTR